MKRSRKRQASTLRQDVLSWLGSKRVESTASYIRQGRRFAGLSDQVLLENWKAAFCAMANNYSAEAQREEDDLSSEIGLRGLELPYDDSVEDAVELFSSKVGEHQERLKSDPEAFQSASEAIDREFQAFKAKRDRSN
jgi:hypothetical protein